MAYSGTYAFAMTRDDLIGGALRLCQAYGDQDVIPANDITNCAQALNIIMKEMALEGMPLWCIKDITIPLVANQATYNVSTASGTTLPLRILDAYLRNNATNSDIVITLESRYDYNQLGLKNSTGVPNQGFYDPQLGGGIITLYNVPADNNSTLHLVIQRQLQDINIATENPDFPQEAFRMLKWCLADEIGLEYNTPKDVRMEVNQKAIALKTKFFDAQQEQVSVRFTPTDNGRK